MSRAPSDHFGFVRIAMAVLLIVMLANAADILADIEDADPFPAGLLLLVVLIFIFAEVYAVLAELHGELGLPYAQPWLYMDLLTGGVVLWMAAELRNSAQCELSDGAGCTSDLGPAMRVGIIVFVAFLARLVIGFRMVDRAKKTEEARRRFYLRVVADLFGIGLTAVVMLAEPDGFLGLSVFGWSVVGAGVVLVYFVVRAAGVKVQLKLG
ncbi:MAG: hypothetical protein QNJ12_17525 [Ilumatobacter sp.]|uniref:hypothetical protein n=1 Tax=Ilumatobacter sp. TaxID=1967498 RepID=UPI002638176C|nr:hypothetical protein [Ilumatobacter sp.]MDJ0770598.1 hypothetical protein [Ilumatobacter sp.]